VCHVFFFQETSNKDLSLLAKSAFELLKWRILCRPFLETAVAAILSSVSDPNWRTRSALLSYLRTFTYRFNYSFFVPNASPFFICTLLKKIEGEP
jgi:proteasome activator subunit 4